jgi:hypothetical protein
VSPRESFTRMGGFFVVEHVQALIFFLRASSVLLVLNCMRLRGLCGHFMRMACGSHMERGGGAAQCSVGRFAIGVVHRQSNRR